MPQIDFYILADSSVNARHVLACRLAEKAYQRGHKVYVYTASAPEATLMDELLWTFRSGSFLPHCLFPAAEDPCPPVLVGCSEGPDSHRDVLINLTQEVPPFFEHFTRVVEPVDENEKNKQAARERFRIYRDRGYPPETHKIAGPAPND